MVYRPDKSYHIENTIVISAENLWRSLNSFITRNTYLLSPEIKQNTNSSPNFIAPKKAVKQTRKYSVLPVHWWDRDGFHTSPLLRCLLPYCINTRVKTNRIIPDVIWTIYHNLWHRFICLPLTTITKEMNPQRMYIEIPWIAIAC